jgi:antitoxin MazE
VRTTRTNSELVNLTVVFDGHIGYTFLLYILEVEVRVSKWGNSLAVRLPSLVVEALDLKEGDEIEIQVVSSRRFEVARDKGRERALARLKALSRPLPKGFRFDRDEANER